MVPKARKVETSSLATWNRVGNLRTRGPEIGASYPAEPIEKAIRNLPADC